LSMKDAVKRWIFANILYLQFCRLCPWNHM
jgi:hypothetical protein